MKSFGKYISKHLASFALFVVLLMLVNAISFVLTFRSIITSDYGSTAPQTMLEKAVTASTEKGMSDEMVQELRENQIWAMFLQNIATEAVVGLNLDFISLGTNKIRKTLAHIAGASVSKS